MKKSELPPLLSDMDGVLADFDGKTLERAQLEIPGFVKRPRTNFYIREDYPEHLDAINQIQRGANFFGQLEVIEGAQEGLQRIRDLGYAVRICTAALSDNPYSAQEKLEWLERHIQPYLGRAIVETAIIDKQKHKYSGFALIDDRPEVNEELADWSHIIYDQPYNQQEKKLYRLDSWSDDKLGEILEDTAKRYSDINQ